MPVRQSKALALLQKANSQLKGERVPLKSKEEDELAVYLSSLTNKKQQPKAVNFEDYGEISISSGTDPRNSVTPRGRRSASPASKPTSSKFLKKKNTLLTSEDDVQQSKTKSLSTFKSTNIATNKLEDSSSVKFHQYASVRSESESESKQLVSKSPTKKILITKNGEEKKNNFGSPSPRLQSRSSSAERRNKKGKKNEIVRTLGDVYLSSDEESLAEFIHNLSVSDSTAKQPQNLVAKKHQKWHKKVVKSPSPVERSSPFKRTSSPLNKKSRSPSPLSKKSRSPSPLNKKSRSHSLDSDLVDSFDSEITEDVKGRNKSLDELHHVNLKDVSSLKSPSFTPHGQKSPVKTSSSSIFKASSSVFKAGNKGSSKASLKHSKSKSSSKNTASSIFENLGIHLVDELISVDNASQSLHLEVDISEESQIETERSDDRKKVLPRQKSESEILTDIGGKMAPHDPDNKNSQFPKSAEGDMREMKHRKEIDTDQEYSDSFLSDSELKSETQSKSVSQISTQRSHKSKSGRRDKTLQKRKHHKIILEEQEVDLTSKDQRGDTHHWNTKQSGFLITGPYGLQYVDPKPVATHVVSADALEALTAYSPNMLALQEMMKAQLELVQNFVAIQTRIYQSCMEGLNHNYKYTTLEDTKEYIRQHRKTPLTFKEALQLVEQEQNA
ncbi:uncharacterized protein C19orf44-like [Biomphalaria glabrata]|uniref:Uncharacterized protein C19orf44-like n=1 Tax=Biomphalaria glabrata TaxID=6526 RepID=A0A9W3ADQ0_BIOGL|nr:uncharacterized protein C19orf44-like [Biomphalaria glabrata]XP_055885409.1 uncharacterized protein C19orf44-like [Biomphalaria glabrata]XP_055885410.1 uncharacterized protein C19orf44-like [Biomphalaria glabrata]XP_055885411.1 uncharacterized protein C19orf44-like [Biomphalaria glabrata]XP_055885412.1 uncharacterized protein C19orf44-like [Biomphalaria glabrata]XP_055885413.1 uncharacterized protein C19orf44-like [Biomphalaria glabrata]XP_055885414.1 uncharacterized protein C19orf44-like 